MNKIRKGDQVIVIAGRDKGKRGVVTLRADDSHDRVGIKMQADGKRVRVYKSSGEEIKAA